jgi:ABC-type nitrate/sulfonate/bicarbonate transport system permease component
MKNNLKNKVYPTVFFIVLIIIWEGISRLNVLPQFILPSPSKILISLFINFRAMQNHILITLYETLIGFSIAIFLSVAIAILMDAILTLKKTLYPLLIISQTIPIIILAPLFIIWFGYGYLPKIIIVILICFFPITISLLQGLTTVDKEFIDLMRSMGASRYQIYRLVKIPSAMPNFFSGLKIAATYSIMGATIGEWVGGKNGLGVYMIRAKHSFATDRVFASIIIITVLSILLLKIIEFTEKKYMPWLKISEGVYIEE